MAFLYVLTFGNGKQYVGQTRVNVGARIRGHAASARLGSQYPIHTAWRKHGRPSVQIIPTPLDQLDKAESALMARLKSQTPRGYNIKPGGNASGHSDSTRAKLAAAMMGKKRSAETRRKMSESITPELRAKYRAIYSNPVIEFVGPTIDRRILQSRRMSGRTLSPEHRFKISESQKRRHALRAKKGIRGYSRKSARPAIRSD